MKSAMSLCMFVLLMFFSACSVAASAPEIGAAPTAPNTTVQFTEVTWPNILTNLPGWELTNFTFGTPPRLTSTGGQGVAVDVRSREGDTLVALSYAASGNGSASALVRVYAITASGGAVLSEVFDQRRPAGFAPVPMPLATPHLMAPGEGLVLQLDSGSQGYQVSSILATWTRTQ